MSDSDQRGLRLSIIYYDPDLVELDVVALNGRFYGAAALYTTRSELKQLGAALVGFPSSRSDVRQFDLGAFDATRAGGGLKVRLECTDSAGHCTARVFLEARESSTPESVALRFSFEPAMVDSFIRDLVPLTADEPEHGMIAHLRATN